MRDGEVICSREMETLFQHHGFWRAAREEGEGRNRPEKTRNGRKVSINRKVERNL